jgi:hypothetical protein
MENDKSENTVVLVGNCDEGWWDLKDCTFLFVKEKTAREMGEDCNSKWWRYFEDNSKKLIKEVHAPQYIRDLIKENEALKTILKSQEYM